MKLSKDHKSIRVAIVDMLDHPSSLNKLFLVEHLTLMCNISAGSDVVTVDDVMAAFKNSSDMVFANDVLGVDDEDDDAKHVVRYVQLRPTTGARLTCVGRYETSDMPVGNPMTKTVRVASMTDEVKQSLELCLQFLREKKRKRAAADAQSNNNKKKKKAKKSKSKAVAEKERRELEEKKRREEEERRELEKQRLEAMKQKQLKDVLKHLEAQRDAFQKVAEAKEKIAKLEEQLLTLGCTSTRSSPMQVDEGNGRKLYYILDGRGGFINYPEGVACVLDHELMDGLQELPEGKGDDYNQNEIRRTRAYELCAYGATQYFLPAGASSGANNHQVRKEGSHDIIKELHDLFTGEQSGFGEEAKRIAAAFNVQGYGASDEATEMMAVGWTKALLHQLGISDKDISAADIAKGCPSRRTNVRSEASLAADCMIVVLQEIIDDEAKHFALITDHGKRSGLEHFVKILVWAGWEDKEKTRKIIKFHCLDVDTSAHDADGCAEAVKNSLEEFSGLDGFKVTVITGDAGGGASVHNLLPALVKANVVDADTAKINCLMHALNKCLEAAGQDTFGQQGMNKRTPYQLLYVFNQLWKAIKEEGGNKLDGKKYLDEIYSIVVDKLLNDESWQNEAKKNFKQAFGTFKDTLDKLEDLDDDAGIDDLVHFITETPSNIQDPVFSRWKTVMACTRVVLQYWSQIYFVAVAVKQHQIAQKKHTSYLCTLSSTLLSLMKEKGTSDPEAYYKESDEDLIVDTFDEDLYLVEEHATQPTLQRNDTPVFYAMLLFFRGFGDAYFDDCFNFTMKDDPILGEGSYGQISRFCVERCYIMHKILHDMETGLETGTWMERAEFKEYRAALQGVNNPDEFKKMTTIFFQRFRHMFDKHVASCWRSDTILHYIIGGNPTLAKEFARWLVDYDVMVNTDGEEDDGDDEDDDEIDVAPPYQFTDKTINMGPFHYRTKAKKQVRINVRECMEYLTADADRSVIMSTPFVKTHWNLIQKMGMCEDVVDLFDKDSWGHNTNGVPNDFSTLRDAIWNEIAIHSTHQQRCENYVQLAALVSRTNVGEVRRTQRAIILSTIIRPFHMWAKKVLVERHPDKYDKKPPRRVEGHERGELLIKYMLKFSKKLARAKRALGKQRYDEIKEKLMDSQQKTSATYRNEQTMSFKESLENNVRRITKSEEAAGRYDKTIFTEGGISFKLLTMSNSCRSCNAHWKKRKYRECRKDGCCMAALHAELKHHKIHLSKQKLCGLKISEKRKELRKALTKVKMVDQMQGQQGFNASDVKYFVPQTSLGKSLQNLQKEMNDREAGAST